MYDIQAYNSTSTLRLPLRKMRRVVQCVMEGEQIASAAVNVIVVNDVTIHELNNRFLNHDYVTDVLTFSLEEEAIEGEIYVCAQRAKQQATEYGVSFTNELMRLAAHGALHLAGYNDESDVQRQQMKELEDRYMDLASEKFQ